MSARRALFHVMQFQGVAMILRVFPLPGSALSPLRTGVRSLYRHVARKNPMDSLDLPHGLVGSDATFLSQE